MDGVQKWCIFCLIEGKIGAVSSSTWTLYRPFFIRKLSITRTIPDHCPMSFDLKTRNYILWSRYDLSSWTNASFDGPYCVGNIQFTMFFALFKPINCYSHETPISKNIILLTLSNSWFEVKVWWDASLLFIMCYSTYFIKPSVKPAACLT